MFPYSSPMSSEACSGWFARSILGPFALVGDVRGHLATESDWLVAMSRFFSRLKVLAHENPGDQEERSHTISTAGKKRHIFNWADFCKGLKQKPKQNGMFHHFCSKMTSSMRNPLHGINTFSMEILWLGREKWSGCFVFSSSSQMIRQGDPSF